MRLIVLDLAEDQRRGIGGRGGHYLSDWFIPSRHQQHFGLRSEEQLPNLRHRPARGHRRTRPGGWPPTAVRVTKETGCPRDLGCQPAPFSSAPVHGGGAQYFQFAERQSQADAALNPVWLQDHVHFGKQVRDVKSALFQFRIGGLLRQPEILVRFRIGHGHDAIHVQRRSVFGRRIGIAQRQRAAAKQDQLKRLGQMPVQRAQDFERIIHRAAVIRCAGRDRRACSRSG
jgi:hypothetical protein